MPLQLYLDDSGSRYPNHEPDVNRADSMDWFALGGILMIGWFGYRAHSYGTGELPHDDDTPEDRHRFMGFATLLISGLSAVAVIYVALVVAFIETCQ